MKTPIIALLLLLWSCVALGLDYEVGVPTKEYKGVKVGILRVVESRCWKWLDGGVCIQRGLTFAQAEFSDSESVRFFGGNLFAKFDGVDYWNRIGFGFGLFDKKTERIRSGWDFNISVQYGIVVSENVSLTFGWDHWSNGRSFAEILSLDKYWPENNDGANTLLAGLRVRW